MPQILEVLDKDIRVIILIVFYVSKKLEERLNILSRDMEVIKKRLKLNF